MANSSNSTDQLISQAKLGDEAALVDLIVQVGPRLRQAVDAELEAVQHNLDAAQMWNEIQAETKRRVGEFQGTTEDEFEAWAARLALRHIRYSAGGRSASIETMVNTSQNDTLSKPAKSSATPAAAAKDPDQNATISPDNQASPKFDPNATWAPANDDTAEFDPNATLAPDSQDTAKFDPNATLAPGANDTIAPDAFAIPKHDPDATITDLAAIPLAPQATKIFGDYEILETIAKGGMGVVYKARQRKLNRIVALKMILAGQFADEGDIERFYVEAEAAAQLRHPNIVGIFEVGECEGQHYFSMEYIEGKSLGDLVREHPLAPLEAARFVKAISEAMHYAHEKGVLHRDLKPSNVLVDSNDEPLITDFGLAKRTEEQSQRTAAGSVLGTPSYMPPEQAAGKLDLISERSDVYSIGAILYELITGKPPFGAANPWDTIRQVISNEPVSPRLLNNSVPADLETICLKCLEKDQARRYNSAQDLADELERFLAGEPILARPISVFERSVRWCYRNPWPTAALGVLLLGVVGTSVGLGVAIVAKRAAVAAKDRAVVAEGKAVDAKETAESEKRRAELSRDQLLAAINRLFTDWGDVKLLNEPGFEGVRSKLLATASDLYEQMGKQLGEDPKVRQKLGEAYFRLGRMMFHLQSYENARNAFEKGLTIQEEFVDTSAGGEESLHALGESLNHYGKALEVIAVRQNGALQGSKNGLRDVEAIYELAIERRGELADRYPDKLEYKRQQLNSRMNHGLVPEEMGNLLVREGNRLVDGGDDQGGDAYYKEADTFYREAQSRVEKLQGDRLVLLGQLDIKVRSLGANVQQQLSELLARPDESGMSKQELRDLLTQLGGTEATPPEFRELLAQPGESEKVRETLDDLLARLGETENVKSELRGLLARLDEMERVQSKLHELLPRFDETVEIQKEPRELLTRLDETEGVQKKLHELLPRLDESKEIQTKLRELLKRLEETESLRKGLRDALAQFYETAGIRDDVVHDLAQGYYNLTRVMLWLGDFAKTDQYITEANRAFDSLLARHPKQLEYQFDQSLCWILAGDAKRAQSRETEALQEFKMAERTLERLANGSTSVPTYRRTLAEVQLRIGRLHVDVKDHQKALAAFESASEILTNMVDDFPNVPYLRDLLDDANSRIGETNLALKKAAESTSTTVPETEN